jgi:hypothetical protein
MRFILFLCAVVLSGQPKPNFSGTWVLNLEASDYSAPNTAKPDKLTWTIQQKGDHFKYKVERIGQGNKAGFEAELTVGGSPYESDAAGIIEMEWKGVTLVVKTLYNPGQDRQSDNFETWKLSADGKRLTDDLTIHPPRNGSPVRVVRVFDKQ